MTRVLVITGDPLGARMAGPGIRSWNIARVLSSENEVVLMTTTRLESVDAPFRVELVRPGEDAAFDTLHDWADVVVFQGHALDQFDALRTSQKVLVADIYDPMHLEMLEQGRELGLSTWNLRVSTATRVLNDQLALADYFLCASERQRLFYLGQLAGLRRITPATYGNDPHLRGLLDVAPFGLPAELPVHERAAIKGVVPGINAGDRLLIWGGGIYSWFDPKSLIRAVSALSKRRPDLRLFFLGTKHPGVDEMGIVRESFDLARELGVLDSAVFFNQTWVEYADRQNHLVEADAGVSTHMSHLETTFSFRTRILDYLWAGLPMVVTDGDAFAELVEAEGLGLVVPAEDVAALESAIDRVLYDEEFAASTRRNVERVREDFVWERALAPLVEFVRAPRRAADQTDGRSVQHAGRRRKPYGVGHDLRMFWHYLRAEGARGALRRVTARMRRN
ncbi:glycosyltransferase [Leifsonia sp. H3M29-4]|uniref:glycosyltransferase n=1 Tax=Salinibacterium metalliresistens TaxID=3031321 RepID=UPI0023DB35B3|nr:glycosyltransferase [Salinibacterium metalliresistens]MDF1479149.1 glycosyltransferase [Salinibacterium metalliresistens]